MLYDVKKTILVVDTFLEYFDIFGFFFLSTFFKQDFYPGTKYFNNEVFYTLIVLFLQRKIKVLPPPEVKGLHTTRHRRRFDSNSETHFSLDILANL